MHLVYKFLQCHSGHRVIFSYLIWKAKFIMRNFFWKEHKVHDKSKNLLSKQRSKQSLLVKIFFQKWSKNRKMHLVYNFLQWHSYNCVIFSFMIWKAKFIIRKFFGKSITFHNRSINLSCKQKSVGQNFLSWNGQKIVVEITPVNASSL